MENTEKIKDYCETNCLPFLGGIPYDKRAVELINKGKTIVDENCASGVEAEKIFYNFDRRG